MAKIKKIQLINYRNFKDINIDFSDKSNVFHGINGSGKTNILEGISLLSKGKGFRNSNYSNLIKQHEKNFLVKSILEIDKINYDIEISSRKINSNYKKILKVNDDTSKDSINILHKSLSYLIFLPEMERLFQASPNYRRNFIDRLIFSSNSNYNKIINKYKKYLIERNIILQQEKIDTNWINFIELEISKFGIEIYNLRNLQLQLLNDYIKSLNMKGKYNFELNFEIKDDFYEADLHQEKYLDSLKISREYDIKFGGVKFGPHKSDILAKINNNFDASQLSTGQQKTIVLIMLLAQCFYLVNEMQIEPILLFDEVCSHLDSHNREILLEIINQFNIQLFLTSTDKTLFSFISTNIEFYNITEL